MVPSSLDAALVEGGQSSLVSSSRIFAQKVLIVCWTSKNKLGGARARHYARLSAFFDVEAH
jgi:hypothetical protein